MPKISVLKKAGKVYLLLLSKEPFLKMESNLMKKTIELAKKVLSAESEAIESLKSTINENFETALSLILNTEGKVVLTGVGKSGIIAQKISATLNSTGQKAVFLHAADALHGDLGILDKNDIVIGLSKSGETEELIKFVTYIKAFNCKMIAMTSEVNSSLARMADCTLEIPIKEEACQMNLAPTSSTTATMALGDAMAICLMDARNFSENDFARNHPSGSLGKKLWLRVGDVYSKNAIPKVAIDAKISEVIMEITSKRLGATAVVDTQDLLTGIITDGDLRRMLTKYPDYTTLTAKDIMGHTPKTISPTALAKTALDYMKSINITQLIVAEDRRVLGFVHLHDLLNEGLN